MFFFIIFLLISLFGLVFGIRALLIPNSWPFNRNKDELILSDIIRIKFRGIFLLAISIVMALASIKQLVE
ncbi:hypothetical protein J2T16_003822 [Paenibacillus intestini]|nr:hypothetical protein [Paenibacillus intestini]